MNVTVEPYGDDAVIIIETANEDNWRVYSLDWTRWDSTEAMINDFIEHTVQTAMKELDQQWT